MPLGSFILENLSEKGLCFLISFFHFFTLYSIPYLKKWHCDELARVNTLYQKLTWYFLLIY